MFSAMKSLQKLSLGDFTNQQLKNTDFDSIKNFNFLDFTFNSLNLTAKCFIYKRFMEPLEENRKIKNRQYYQANFLSDDTINGTQDECLFMLYFFKFKLVFNLFYNEHKSMHDCITLLRKNNFNLNSFNLCGYINQRIYSNSSFVQNDLYIVFNIYNSNIILYSSYICLIFFLIYYIYLCRFKYSTSG